MDMYINLLKSSIKIAYNYKRICLLGFMQFFAIYLTIKLLNNFNLINTIYTLLLIIFSSVVTVILWKYIEAIKSAKKLELEVTKILNLMLKFCLVLLLSFITVFVIKYSRLTWNYSVITICFFSLFIGYILLGLVSFKLSIFKSYLCALDFIKNKFALFYSLFITLVLINIFSYYISHLAVNIRVLGGGFSVFMPSATIWLVFLGVALLATFFSGVVNIFFVLLFLEISKIIKAPTEIETPLVPAQTS